MLNRVELIGRLGKDPEARKTNSQSSVTNFNLVTAERYKDKNTGERKELTQWHNVVCWGSLADIAGRYLGKGQQVYVSGKLQTRSYEDSTGTKRYITEVVAQELIMLGQKENRNGQPLIESSGTPSLGSSQSDDLPF